MQQIHELLSRIQWDKDFGDGTFELGIYDQVEDRIKRMPMAELTMDESSKGR
ncbi:MAG: hypothetical protein ACI9TH_000891 [Kiritimatiellia bacterium]|jgi:hypothetical protein